MSYKNTSVRLLTINTEKGGELTLAPGETGTLKGPLGNAQEYVDDLIERGELTEVDAPKETKTDAGK